MSILQTDLRCPGRVTGRRFLRIINMANGGDYNIVPSRNGKSGFFGSTRTTNPNMDGVYEWGMLLKMSIVRSGLE